MNIKYFSVNFLNSSHDIKSEAFSGLLLFFFSSSKNKKVSHKSNSRSWLLTTVWAALRGGQSEGLSDSMRGWVWA